MDAIKVLVYPPEASVPARFEYIDPASLEAMQTLVGGDIQLIGGLCDWADTRWAAFVHEEGKVRGMPVNGRATWLAHSLGWPTHDFLVGTVAFCGPTKDGHSTSVPQLVIDLAP